MDKFSGTMEKLKKSRCAPFMFGCAVLAVFFLFALISAVSQFSWDLLLQGCLKAVNSSITGRAAVGKIEVHIDALKLEDITLKLDEGGELADIKSAQLNFEWMRALKRMDYMAVLGDLQVKSFNINPEIDSSGVLNFSKLKSKNPSPEKNTKTDWEQFASRYDGKITLEDGQLFFRDLSKDNFCAQLDNIKISLRCVPGCKSKFSLSFVPLQKANSFDPESGKIALEGSIALSEAPDFSADLELSRINLARLSDYPVLPAGVKILDGEINSKLWASCRADSWSEAAVKLNYGGQFNLNRGSVMAANLPQPIDNIFTDIRIYPGMAEIYESGASFDKIQALLKGKVFILPPGENKEWSGRLKASLKVPDVNLKRLSDTLKLNLPLAGSVGTDISAEGPLNNPVVKGSVVSPKLRYDKYDVKDVCLKFAYEDKLLNLESLKASAAGGLISGSGYVLFEGSQPQAVFNVSGKSVSLEQFSPVGGFIDDFKVAFVGTPKDPLVYGSGSGIGGFTGQASMLQSARGSFMFSDNTISLNNAEAVTSLGSAELSYASYDIKNPFIYALVSTPGISLPALELPQVGTLIGTVSGGAQIFGNPADLSSLSVCAYSESTDVRLGGLSIENLHGPVGLSNMTVFFPEMSGLSSGGSVAASGWVGLQGGNSSVSLNASGVEIAPFIGVANVNIPLLLEGTGDIGASWYSPDLGRHSFVRLYLDGILPEYSNFAYEIPASASDLLAVSAPDLKNSAEQVTEKTEADVSENEIKSEEKSEELDGTEEGLIKEETPKEVKEAEDKAEVYAYPRRYRAAAEGWAGTDILKLSAWSENLALNGMAITEDLRLQGSVTGKFGVWGSPKNVNFGYLASVFGSPLNKVSGNTLLAAGEGGFADSTLRLDNNILAWEYINSENSIPHYTGESYGIFGPNLAPPLLREGRLKSMSPAYGMIKADGFVNLGSSLSYQLSVEAKDIDLSWLKKQSSLPAAATLLDSALISEGTASLYGKIISEHGVPKVVRGTYAQIPWFMAGGENNRRVFSACAAISTDTVLKDGKYSMGAFNIDRLLAANAASGSLLPSGKDIFSKAELSEGIMDISGSLKGTEVALAVSGRGWNTSQLLAFVPNSDDKVRMLAGTLKLDDLRVSFDMGKGILDTLSMTGSMGLYNGHVALADGIFPIDEISANVNHNSGNLVFSDLLINSGGIKIHGRASRDINKNWEAGLYSEDVPFKHFAYFMPELNDLGGAVDWAVSLKSHGSDCWHAALGIEGKDVSWNSSPASISLPDFRIGRVSRDEDGKIVLSDDSAVLADINVKEGRASVSIPEDSFKFSTFRYAEAENLPENLRRRIYDLYASGDEEEKTESRFKLSKNSLFTDKDGRLKGLRLDRETASLDISGRFDFGLDFKDGLAAWAAGPEGPNFGSEDSKFNIKISNFRGNLIRAALGLPMSERQFSFSGALGLKGQWYEGHKLGSLPGSLDYGFEISDLTFGSISSDDVLNSKNKEKSDSERKFVWRGLTLKNGMKGAYRREQASGRLIIEPFEFVPENRQLSADADNEKSGEGKISGSVNVALTSVPRNRRSEQPAGSASEVPRPDVNEVYFNISNVPISELGSFIFPGLNSGFVNSFVLNSSGPVLSPTFNMIFNISDAEAGSVNIPLIAGAVSGSRDRETKKYQVRFGTINNAVSSRLGNVVYKGLEDVLKEGDDYSKGIQVYFGDKKSEDHVFSISGVLPYEASRVQTENADRLLPFWHNVSVDLLGNIDVTSSLHDKNLGLLEEISSDIKDAKGDMAASMHIGGNLLKPEIIGGFKVSKGSFEHEKAGSISDLNIDIDFSRISDPDVTAAYIEQKRTRLQKEAQELKELIGEQADTEDSRKKEEKELEDSVFSRIAVNKFTGLLGGREFTIDGKADFDGLEPLAADLSLFGEQLPLQWGSLISGTADVDIKISKNQEPGPKALTLEGNINLPSGELSLDLDTLMSSSSGNSEFDWSSLPVDYKVNITMGDDVWASAFGCRIRAAGDLAVVPGPDGKPVIDGAIDLSRGLISIPLYDVSFKVRSGRAVFNHSQMPELSNIQADASVDGYEITANVNGTYPDISMEMVSNPPLAESDIQRLLALGSISKTAPSAGTPDMNIGTYTGARSASSNLNMGSSGVSMLSKLLTSSLTQKLSRMLFLSDLSVDMKSPNGYSFKIAKAIDSKDTILLTLTKSFDSKAGIDASVYGIEWRFKSNMLVRLGCDQHGQICPWFQGFWDF